MEADSREKLSGEANLSAEIARLKTVFEGVLFANQDSRSFFSQESQEDIDPIRPSETIIRNEAEFFKDSAKMFALIEKLLNPSQSPYVPIVTTEINHDEFTTYCTATLEKKQDPSFKVYPNPQLWITEYGLMDIDREKEEEKWANRKDNKIISERERYLNLFQNLARKDTVMAAERKEDVLQVVAELSKKIIEMNTIQYQEVDENKRFTPKIGIKLYRYLDGYQAYPFVQQGRQPFILFDRPLLPGKEVQIEDMGSTLELNLVSEEDFQGTDIKKIVDSLLSQVDFNDRN